MLKEHTSEPIMELMHQQASDHHSEYPQIASSAASHMAGLHIGRMPLKRELEAMPFKERLAALMGCADYHLDEIDRIEHGSQAGRLTEWDRRQLTSHRSSLKRVLDRAREFGIKLSIVEE